MFLWGRFGHYGSNCKDVINSAPLLAESGQESTDKAENIMIGVVHRHGCNAESVWLAPVTDNALPRQPFTERFSVPGDADGELCASLLFFRRRNDREFGGRFLIQQVFQITGQRLALGAQTV